MDKELNVEELSACIIEPIGSPTHVHYRTNLQLSPHAKGRAIALLQITECAKMTVKLRTVHLYENSSSATDRTLEKSVVKLAQDSSAALVLKWDIWQEIKPKGITKVWRRNRLKNEYCGARLN